MLQARAHLEKEQRDERQERVTFRKLSIWQHAATYLLYFVMLMNVFITTFGISGSEHNVFGASQLGAAAAAARLNSTAPRGQ